MSSAPVKAGTWICNHGDIRVSPNGQPSVFDMIRVLGGSGNPRRDWARITETNPEVVPKTYNLQFPGPGQRDTPVTKTKEDAYYILGLLPGAVGKQYREDAAKLFVTFLDKPEKVAYLAADRLSEEELRRLEARLKGKRTRHMFTEVLHQHGVVQGGYGQCTNAVYTPLFGRTADLIKTEIAQEHNIDRKKVNPRDFFDLEDLTYVETAERVAAGQLRRKNIYGNHSVAKEILHSTEYTKKLLDGDIDIPAVH
jgi:hypothetical protein